MSMRNQRPSSRRERRQSSSDGPSVAPKNLKLPGPLALLTNPKVFLVMGLLFIGAFVISAFAGALNLGTTSTSDDGILQQANELPDAPIDSTDADGTPVAQNTPQSTIKRYTTAPAITIDTSKRYLATVVTNTGEFKIEMDASKAPQTVNSFVFLAREGYYNNNPAILGKTADGSFFSAAFGDPTGTGNVRPGYTTPAESTSSPFVKGAVGMGDSQTAANDGRFWVSYTDQPALNGRYTIFGQVTSGNDVVEKLQQDGKIVSVTVEEL